MKTKNYYFVLSFAAAYQGVRVVETREMYVIVQEGKAAKTSPTKHHRNRARSWGNMLIVSLFFFFVAPISPNPQRGHNTGQQEFEPEVLFFFSPSVCLWAVSRGTIGEQQAGWRRHPKIRLQRTTFFSAWFQDIFPLSHIRIVAKFGRLRVCVCLVNKVWTGWRRGCCPFFGRCVPKNENEFEWW